MSPQILLTKIYHFSSAHRLYHPDYSDEKNLQIFGKCSNPNGHGHNYTLEVSVAGDFDRETGFIINLGELDEIISKEIIEVFDHKNINEEIPFFRNQRASSENILLFCWQVLKPLLPGLKKLKLQETPNNIFILEE